MFKNLSTFALGVSGRQSEIIELALSYKFKSIELDVEDFRAQVQTGGLQHARRLIDSARLNIGLFRIPLDLEADDTLFSEGLAQLGKLAGMVSQIGCTRCVTRVAPANDERPYHQNFEFYRRRLIEIAKVLEPLGMQLGLEVEADPAARADYYYQFVHSLDALVMLVGMTGRKNIGVVVDLYNLHSTGHVIEEVKKLDRGQVTAVYVSDAPETDDPTQLSASQRVLPGETGVIDASAALAQLAELGFDGPVIPAADSKRFEGMSRNAIVKLAAEKLDEVWKGAGLTPSGKLSPSVVKK